jgi:hypothetical protein
MERKFKNLTEQLQQQNQQLLQTLEKVAAPKKEAAAPPTDDLAELQYTDPGAYARKIAEIAAEEASKRVNQTITQSNEINSTLQRLTMDYPELQDTNSDLYKTAMRNYDNMSDGERKSAKMIQLAIREAAAEVGVQVASKRKGRESDDFSFGGDGMSSSKNNNNRKNKDDKEIAPETITLSQLLGQNVDDPKYKARIKKAVNRKSYTKYE